MVVFLCGGGCIYAVVVAVHGGFAAVTQPRIYLEERSPCECTVLGTDSRCPMYCARIRLLSLARPGVSENVTRHTLARHLPEHLYRASCPSRVFVRCPPTSGSSSPHSSRYWKLSLALKPI